MNEEAKPQAAKAGGLSKRAHGPIWKDECLTDGKTGVHRVSSLARQGRPQSRGWGCGWGESARGESPQALTGNSMCRGSQ